MANNINISRSNLVNEDTVATHDNGHFALDVVVDGYACMSRLHKLCHTTKHRALKIEIGAKDGTAGLYDIEFTNIRTVI